LNSSHPLIVAAQKQPVNKIVATASYGSAGSTVHHSG